MKKRYWFAILCAALALVLTLAAASADAGDEYKKMTDVSGLHDGDRIILVSDDGNYYQAMATDYSGVQVTVTDNTITEQSDMLVLTLAETEDGWFLAADGGYLSANSGSLVLVADQADAATWSISIASDGTATVSCADGNIVFAEQNGAYRFFCGEGGNEVAIYNATFEPEQHAFGDNLWWTFSNGKLTIGGSGSMPDYSRTNQPWYSLRSEITDVEIQDGVTSIGNCAFYDCSNLTGITIPNGVTSIGSGAFYLCTGLTEITIPDGVTNIGWGAFYGCSGLTEITIPDSVTTIGDEAFCGCRGLQSITIPDSVTSVGVRAFYCCTGLTEITIPDSVTSIGSGAFDGCRGLTEITIPSSVTDIGDSAFYNCTGLHEIAIPDSVTNIGWGAFSGCSGLQTVTIGNGVTSIGNAVFSDCSGLTSIAIPDSVTSIGELAFCNCQTLTSVTIPDGVTSIGTYAFCYCTGLSSIVIPDSVTSIGDYAFTGCTGLTDVYYLGTEAQKNEITIGSSNNNLLNAAWHYLNAQTVSKSLTLEGKIKVNFYAVVSDDALADEDSYALITFNGVTTK